VLGLATYERRGASAQESATPGAGAPIPPIRWHLASIDARESTITPGDPARYWAQFLGDGVLHIRADCNTGSGAYEIDGQSISITSMISTLAMCGDDSIDRDFLNALSAASSYSISSDGSDQLVLTIDDDGASALFSAALTGVVWQWEQFAAGNDTTITPTSPDRYTLEFLEDGSIHVVADCNSGGGKATVDGNQLDLNVSITKVACGEGSSFDDYARILNEATTFVIRDGQLHLALPMDAGIATFQAVVPDQNDAGATPES
jgi:heat shock protein HslJ